MLLLRVFVTCTLIFLGMVSDLLIATAPAHAVMLCAKKRSDGTFNTSIKIRETCMLKETQLDPVILGLQGPPGPQGIAGSDAQVLHLFDRGNHDLGILVDFPFHCAFTGRVDCFNIVRATSIYFESTNCTGDAYIDVGTATANGLGSIFLGNPDVFGTFRIPVGASITTITARSHPDPVPGPCNSMTSPLIVDVYPLEPDLPDLGAPPFHVGLAP